MSRIILNPTVGVAPGTTTMALSGQRQTFYNPYGTESQLRAGLRGLTTGLRGLGEARIGVGVVAAALAFAAVIGYGFWQRQR